MRHICTESNASNSVHLRVLVFAPHLWRLQEVEVRGRGKVKGAWGTEPLWEVMGLGPQKPKSTA